MKWNEIIRSLKEDQNLTQTELANKLNTTQRTLSNWEAGRNEPPYDILIKYAIIFKTTTDYILGLTKDPIQKWTNKNNVNVYGGKNKFKFE